MKRVLKYILARLANWLEIPGELYLSGRYLYFRGMHIFPARNIEMLTVDESVSMHNVMINLWAPVTVEKGANLAHNVSLLTGGHEITEDGMQAKVVPRGDIIIKRGAWIGANATILGGVTIGERSIIAAGSVVTKSVPDCEIWAGNPATLMRALKQK